MPEIYRAFEVTLLIDGAEPQCLEGINLVENTILQDSIGLDTSWRAYRPNLQDFLLSINGVDRGAYLVLRALKRARDRFSFDLRTNDNAIIQQGEGIITALERGHTGNGSEPGWSCQIQGWNELTNL